MDSTMMWIVHNAMNKAHAKMKSKGGVLERLNGISRFYELAAMQLEGCLKFVRQETSYILESSDEQVLSDLSEIRDRLQLRLKESEMAIKDKDRELASLLANLNKPARSKSDPLEEYMVSNRVSGDNEGRDSEICELKNSVDQQVWHIRRQLEPEHKLKGKEGNAEVEEGLNNKKIEHLDSDIGVLKETLDLAFGKMQKAIFGSEVAPIEQQWQRAVERDTMSISLEGFMRDFRENVEEKAWKKQEKWVCFGLKEYWSDLMNEVENLRRDLEPLAVQNEVPKCKTSEKSSADDFDHVKRQRSSKAEELMQEQHEEEKKEEEGHSVSKMIKNHESIIKRKSAEAEELNILKREILRHKANLSSRREEDTFVKRRMQEVMVRLDKLRDWDAKLQETFANYDKFVHGQETPSEKRSPKSDANFSENLELDTLSEIWEKMDKVPYGVDAELQNEGTMLKLEQDESDLKDVIMKEIYITILEGSVKEKCIDIYDNELENLLWRDIWQVLFTEVMNQWKENTKRNNIESQTRDEFYCTTHCTVLSEALKDYGSGINLALAESRNLRAENNLEAAIREDICLTLLREMTKECTKWKVDYETACLLREEIDQLVFHETVKDIVEAASYHLAQPQDIVARKEWNKADYETACLLKEEIDKLVFHETVKDIVDAASYHLAQPQDIVARKERNKWKADYETACLLREEIYKLVFHETVKDIVDTASYHLAQHQDAVVRKEWTKWKADYETACLLREEIDQLVFHETVKDIVDTASYHLAQHQDIVARNFLQSVESLVKEDIYMVFMRETIKEWKMELTAFDLESLIREEIYHFVIVEAVKDAFILFREEADSGYQDKISEVMLFTNKLHNSRQVSSSAENVKEKIGSPLSCSEVEEDMVQSESFGMKGYNADLDSLRLECEAGQLGSSVGIVGDDSEKGYNQVPLEVGSVHYEKLSYCQPKANKKVLLNPSDSMSTPFLQFSEELVNFQHTTKEKLEMNFLRMDNMKHHVDKLAVLISSLRKKESLYREAFRRRCQDLWKAETEVDLLGDQVDVLLGLLEKIYTILNRHSLVLQQYFEVSDILELIKKELNGDISVHL